MSATPRLLGALAALALGAAAPAQAEEAVLNFYNWSDYIAPDVITHFERETGIRVRRDTFDSSEILHAKLVAGRTGYDVVISSTGWAAMQAKGGLLRPLDKALLPNLKNLDPALTARAAQLDPGNRYAVTWLWGYTTVAINVDQVRAALGDMPLPDNAWDLLFAPAYVSRLKRCGVSYLDSASEVLPAALHYLGRPLDTNNPADYGAALALLQAVRPSVTLFSSTGYVDDLSRGALCVAMGWSGDLHRAAQRAAHEKTGQTLRTLLPKTGGVMFFDTMVIPADAPHPENAHRFIDYILRPQVHAALTNHLHYANPNAAARRFVEPAIGTDPTVYPSDAEIARMSVQGAVNNDTCRLMARTFSRFKSGL
ncbi:MAG: polyamine ABC transporter substrate-binding protein [Proteobacteria bacterium]|nr:polyamine ABC transporter substrate-binding protein [Pseudomonadota bacterium]